MSSLIDFFDTFEFTEQDGVRIVELTEAEYDLSGLEFKINSPCRVISKCNSNVHLGRIVIAECDTEWDGLSVEGSIVVRNAENFIVRNCTFTKGNTGSGGCIVITRANKSLIENCYIHDSQTCGIFVEASALAVIRNVKTNKINSQNVFITCYSKAEVTDCEFTETNDTALCCIFESAIQLTNTTIKDSKGFGLNLNNACFSINNLKLINTTQNGINIYQCEQPAVIQNSYFQNTGSSSISIINQFVPIKIINNVFEDIHGNAIIMTEESVGYIANNITKKIEFPAVAVLQKSSAMITENDISGCSRAAICARYAQTVEIFKNKIDGAEDTGISVSDSTDVRIHDNIIMNCLIAGVESYNESQVTVKDNEFDHPGKYCFMCYAGAFLNASNNKIKHPDESMILVSTHGSGDFVENTCTECDVQYTGETTGVIFMNSNSNYENITNDEKRSNDKIKFIPPYQDPCQGMCLKCRKKPRTRFLVPCGHKIFCDECGQEAVKNGESCPLCRFPIASFTCSYTSTWDDDSNLCSICAENEADVVILPCGHTGLCSKCVQNWFSENNTCPICRKEESFMKKIHSNF
ncbi:hypothetical protein TVAG_351610 [Trichomonas vaginalis G3]|uniref:RING-type domain-containing protein n=1 Tax=Trichomonas vaginalis (strain ATCC PRA-98 / G3) TaxID=412133 RepID=A2DZP5_TRIV3|nr:protein ubiquitination [Trichomonas vaginalis G3]EAY14113.1 hypothetical protein TVAG_351610 [Trichomonas vaginalis G3]KAI5525122.1 protein ubiquitination [Trichomonas vaginalis G3]|eukprot:XP_001326336.1 hypothetical protein [Trichomonas vaginalis G3]